MVNHATKNEWLRLLSLHVWLVRSTMPRIIKRQRLLTLYLACDIVMERVESNIVLRRRNTETVEERE